MATAISTINSKTRMLDYKALCTQNKLILREANLAEVSYMILNLDYVKFKMPCRAPEVLCLSLSNIYSFRKSVPKLTYGRIPAGDRGYWSAHSVHTEHLTNYLSLSVHPTELNTHKNVAKHCRFKFDGGLSLKKVHRY